MKAPASKHPFGKPDPVKARAKPRIDEARRFSRSLVTPEGVDLGVTIAAAGERAGAFLIDAIIIVLLLVLLTFFAIWAGIGASGSGTDVAVIVWLVGAFFLRNFYFFAFEVGPRAATPGKRLMKIRVASRSGGVLRTDAIFARNAMREIEVFLPLSFLGAQGGDIDGLISLVGLAWSTIFLFFPLFTPDRLRAGDLVAGTWVVHAPRRALLPDLATVQPMDGRREDFVFSRDQLDVYGIKELQVLEEVLRRTDRDNMKVVADRIRAKIGWRKAPNETDRTFLGVYYAALRQHLEAGLLMGVRRADKNSK